MHQLQVRLDANGVAAPAQRAAWQCSEIVTFFLAAAGQGRSVKATGLNRAIGRDGL